MRHYDTSQLVEAMKESSMDLINYHTTLRYSESHKTEPETVVFCLLVVLFEVVHRPDATY